jgi:hypothetical protein
LSIEFVRKKKNPLFQVVFKAMNYQSIMIWLQVFSIRSNLNMCKQQYEYISAHKWNMTEISQCARQYLKIERSSIFQTFSLPIMNNSS